MHTLQLSITLEPEAAVQIVASQFHGREWSWTTPLWKLQKELYFVLVFPLFGLALEQPRMSGPEMH